MYDEIRGNYDSSDIFYCGYLKISAGAVRIKVSAICIILLQMLAQNLFVCRFIVEYGLNKDAL